MTKTAKSLEPILFVPDAHRPYHSRAAWSLLLAVGADLQPAHILTLGDFADFFCVSSHSKDPRRAHQLEAELRSVRKGLDELDALGAPDKRYLGGNHEDRLTRYLQDKAPELFDSVRIPDLLDLDERGWAYIPYKSDTRLGKLYATHDVGTGASGRFATMRALDAYTHSVVVGHAHRLQYVVEGSVVGEQRLAAQFGWLGDPAKADYMHRARANKDWAQGFGIGYLDPRSQLVYVQPIPIVKSTCVVNGKLYKA